MLDREKNTETLAQYEPAMSYLGRFLEEEIALAYSKEQALLISQKARERFKALVPDLPYIGGKSNPLTENLLGAAYEMGIYEQLESMGMDLEEIGSLNRRALTHYTRWKLTPEIRSMIQSKIMTLQRFEAEAEVSQRKEYPGDWVFSCRGPKEGDNFDFEIEYSSCAIVDLYVKHGNERYLPYICANDYAVFGEMGVFFERSKTIGNGAPVCDFRFKVNGKSPKKVTSVRDLEEFSCKDI